MNFNYYMPTQIFFGQGEVNRLGSEKLPGKKALIVSSSGSSMKKFGYLDKVFDLLRKNKTEYVLFNEILPNPTKTNVMNGAMICRNENCDFVIGLGGGSSIDAAKSIAVMAINPGDYWDYIHGGSGKALPVNNQPLPIIAVTTTAGTGTEADPWTVITKEDTGEKIGFGYNKTFPYFSIVDPDLMMSVPANLTAYQGFDALFHSTEGFIATIANPMSDMFALKSIELLGKYLARAVNNGDDIEARTMVALANTLSGFVETTSSCTSEHSIEHALSGYHPALPHGAGLIMISLEYYKFFADKTPDRFIAMANALGACNSTNPMDFVDCLAKLQSECHVSNLKMSDYGIDATDMNKYAQHAFDTMPGLFLVDRYQLSVDEVVGIIKRSFK